MISEPKANICDILDFNPKRTVKKGEIAPFVEMAFLPTDSRDLTEVGEREFKGSGSKFVNGDTLFARITPCLENGKTAKVSGLPEDVAASGSTEFIVMAAKDPKYDEDYVYYLARLPEFRLYAQARMEGTSGRQRVPWQSLAGFNFNFPVKQQRKRVGEFLKSLDDKIELNRQTNQALEEMAQSVFKSWFVYFEPTRAKIAAKDSGQDPTRAAMAAIAGKTVDQLDTLLPEQIENLTATADLFPDKLIPSDLGEIPDGWEAKPLYETAEYVNGAAFKAVDFCDPEEGLPIIKIAELKQGIYDGTKYTLKEVKQRHFITNDDVLYSWSGSPETSLEVFKWFGGDGWLNQHIFKLNFASDEQKYFTYYLLKHMKPVLIAIAQDKQTTGLGHVTVADMKRLLVPYPDDDLLQEFKKIIAPLYEQCSTIEKENITLSEIRDALLPKLLSGEIEINGEVAQ